MKKSHVKDFTEFLKEDGGVAYATQGGMSGMGAVVSPGVNTCPGVPGSAGSGDFGSSFLPTAALKNTIYKAPKSEDRQGSKRHRRKSRAISQLKSIIKSKTPGKVNQLAPTAAKSFSDFIKDFK